ncbi:hypothetical protein LCGC14_0547430 [marine sediment metagenome]|uniref:Uncharacterized protein n=1 Tax=marine sediment metagenome TaxID=412755 RepID=A0A0F9RR31_9ZZZZ
MRIIKKKCIKCGRPFKTWDGPRFELSEHCLNCLSFVIGPPEKKQEKKDNVVHLDAYRKASNNA